MVVIDGLLLKRRYHPEQSNCSIISCYNLSKGLTSKTIIIKNLSTYIIFSWDASSVQAQLNLLLAVHLSDKASFYLLKALFSCFSIFPLSATESRSFKLLHFQCCGHKAKKAALVQKSCLSWVFCYCWGELWIDGQQMLFQGTGSRYSSTVFVTGGCICL